MSSYFLHINTSTSQGFVMLSDEEGHIIQSISIEPQEQSAQINISIDKIMQAAGITSAQLSAISVLNGPGSYTGLRIGLSTAKGLALGWGIPLILHNYIDVLAHHHVQDSVYAIALMARTDEYYVGIYQNHVNLMAPQHSLSVDCMELLEKYEVKTVFTDNVLGFPEAQYIVQDLDINIQKDICHIAIQKFREKKFDDLAYSEPFYLKPAYVTTPKNNILHKN